MNNSTTALQNINTRIWEKICETDPNRTKKIEGGNFRGTSINPNYIYEKLTSVFGPCGIGWGFEIAAEQYKGGHDVTITHSYQINFWYKDNGTKSGMIPAVGCTDYVFKNKNGWNTDEDAPKKSLTDALTKASQLIGMSADIFGGQWNDSKYVSELRKKYSEENREGGKEEKVEPENENKPSTTKTTPSVGGKKITKPQAGLLFHKFKDSGFSENDTKEYIKFHYNVDSLYALPMSSVKIILALFDREELKILPKNDVDLPINPLFTSDPKDLINEKQFAELLATQKNLRISTPDMMQFIKNNGFDDPTEITQIKFPVIMQGLGDLAK